MSSSQSPSQSQPQQSTPQQAPTESVSSPPPPSQDQSQPPPVEGVSSPVLPPPSPSPPPYTPPPQPKNGVLPPLSAKHKLHGKWTLWYDTPQRKTLTQESWAGCLRKFIDIEYVEDFWGVFRQLQPASKVAYGTDYHMFRAGVEPKWEDPLNANGGKWVLAIPKRHSNAQGGPPSVDDLWLTTLLACIGEQFGADSDQICGVVVSMRKPGDRISVWTREATNEEAVTRIGAAFRKALGVPDSVKIGYQSHADSMKRGFNYNRSKIEQ